MRIIISIIGLSLFALLAYQTWSPKSEQPVYASSEAKSYEKLPKESALEFAAHQEDDKKFDAGSLNKSHHQPSPEDLRASIEKIEADLKDTDAIQRLNDNIVEAEERRKIAQKFEELNHLREQEIVNQQADIEREIVALELNHQKRLHEFGVVQP